MGLSRDESRRGDKGPEWILDGPRRGLWAPSWSDWVGWVLSSLVVPSPAQQPSFQRPQGGAAAWWSSCGGSFRADRPEEGQTHGPHPGHRRPAALHVPSSAFSKERSPVSVPLAAGAFPCLCGPQGSMCPALRPLFWVPWLCRHARPSQLSLGTSPSPRRVRPVVRWHRPHLGLVGRKQLLLDTSVLTGEGGVTLWTLHTGQD